MQNLFGQTRVIQTPDGKEWTLGRLRVALVRAYGEWVAKQEGDPFQLIDRYLGKLPDEELMPLFREAKETKEQLRCFSLACPLARKHLKREEGVAELYRLLLLEHHKDATVEEALLVAMSDPLNAAQAVEHAEGVLPNAERPAAQTRQA